MMPIETSRAIDEVEADFLYDVTEVTVGFVLLVARDGDHLSHIRTRPGRS